MKQLLKKIISDLFYISLITLLVFFVLELLKVGLISNYFDLNLLLLLSIILGALVIILKDISKS